MDRGELGQRVLTGSCIRPVDADRRAAWVVVDVLLEERQRCAMNPNSRVPSDTISAQLRHLLAVEQESFIGEVVFFLFVLIRLYAVRE